MAFHHVEVNGTEGKNLFQFSSKETRADKEETISMHEVSNNFVIQRSEETGTQLGMTSNMIMY